MRAAFRTLGCKVNQVETEALLGFLKALEPEVVPLEAGGADLVVIKGNPLANMKLLFGTGSIRLDDATGKVDRVGGVDYTIKDGIIYDAKALRAEVRAMVARQKAERGIPPGIMTIENAEASTLP